MGTDLLTILIFTIPIFISLEFIIVIIPLLMNRAKVKRRLQSPPEIPGILYRPISSEDQILMRSWYVDRSDSHNYIKKPLDLYPSSVNLRAAHKENPEKCMNVRPEPASPEPEPVKDWNAINKASWRIQKANDAIKNANRAIHEANEAIERANAADLAWMDSLADIDPLDFVAKK
jgi:hypothetical protein